MFKELRTHIVTLLNNQTRLDGRKATEYRSPISIEYGVIKTAEGSARVKIGDTEVMVGVKLEVGEPYPDSLDKGNLMVSGDLLPLASPRFEQGPPKFNAIELPRLVDRAIRASEVIELKKLVVKEGELVWTVIIDVYPINDDGNLIDASSIAAFAALKNTFMPALGKDNKVDYETKTKERLPLEKDTVPLSLSFHKLGNSIILDPTREEEEACDLRMTFGISKIKGEYILNSCQKKGEAPLTSEEIEKIMNTIPKKYDELVKKLKI